MSEKLDEAYKIAKEKGFNGVYVSSNGEIFYFSFEEYKASIRPVGVFTTYYPPGFSEPEGNTLDKK